MGDLAHRVIRFLQTDPIGYQDNVNLYAYVANDPINGVDPTGTTKVCIIEDDGTEICHEEDDGNDGTSYTPPHFEGALPQGDSIVVTPTPQKEEDAACKTLRNNSESTQGVLPAYLTGNDNWNDASTLQGHQNYYQSNVNQWQPLASIPAKIIIQIGSGLAGGTPIGRATSVPLTVGSASTRFGAGNLGGLGLNSLIAGQLKLNQDRVNALQQRLKYLKSRC